MKLSSWTVLIGLLVGLGCLQVTARNAVVLKGYAVGERTDRLHDQETDLAWLRADVQALRSPVRLSAVAQERQLKLVARSTLSSAGRSSSVAAATPPAGGSPDNAVRLAADDTRD